MPIRGAGRREQLWHATSAGQEVDQRFAVRPMMTDGQLSAIRRQTMIVVTVIGESRIHQFRLAAGAGQAIHAAFGIK